MKKKIKYNIFEENNNTFMQCKECLSEYVQVSNNTIKSVICTKCVTRLTWPDYILDKYNKKTNQNTRPQGWHWMKEFVDKDGNVFHKGKEQPELKGTLAPTKIKPPKKRKRKKIKDVNKEMYDLAKEHKKKLKLKRESK